MNSRAKILLLILLFFQPADAKSGLAELGRSQQRLQSQRRGRLSL